MNNLSSYGIQGNIYGNTKNSVYETYKTQQGTITVRKNIGSVEPFVGGSVEHMGSFSLTAAVRPTNCGGCRYKMKPIMGVN